MKGRPIIIIVGKYIRALCRKVWYPHSDSIPLSGWSRGHRHWSHNHKQPRLDERFHRAHYVGKQKREKRDKIPRVAELMKQHNIVASPIDILCSVFTRAVTLFFCRRYIGVVLGRDRECSLSLSSWHAGSSYVKTNETITTRALRPEWIDLRRIMFIH